MSRLRSRSGVPLGQIIKGEVTKVNTFLLYFEVGQRFRIYADLLDPSAALPRLNDTVEVINPIKFTESTWTAVMGRDTICSFSKYSDSQTNPFIDLFQTGTVRNDADEILAIDRLVRRLEPFLTPHAVQLCVKTSYGCVPNSIGDLKSIQEILAKTPNDLQYSNCTSQDYNFLNFDGCCTYSVYPNKIAELDADCDTEYLFGFLAAREIDGCISLKDHLSEILVKFMIPHENLEKLHNCLVLVRKYTVFNEIYQNQKQLTLDYILLRSEDVFVVMSGIDKGRRKLIYGQEESLPTDLKYSYFLQISRMSEIIFGYNSGAECWFEALVSPYEHFRPAEWVYVIVPKELIEIKPFLEERVIYKIFTDERFKYVNLKFYAELYGMKELGKVMVLSVDSIFTKTEFQPVGYPNAVFDDFHEIKSHISNTTDFKTFSFVLNISKKEFQPIMYRSWFPKRHQNLKYFGNINNYQQKVVFWNEGTNSYIDLFLSNRDNHFIPLGLISNMKVIFKNVQVYKKRYLKTTVFTSFEIVNYCPEIRFSCANLFFNDRDLWWWHKNTTPTLLGLYKHIPKNCVVHGKVMFRALVDLKLMMICSKCGKQFMDRCCIYCSSTEKDFQVFMVIHGQDSINTPFYMEVNDIEFLLELAGLRDAKASKAFFQEFFDPLEINFLNIAEDFVINDSNPVLQKLVMLIRRKINYKFYLSMDVVCIRQIGEDRKPWKMIEFVPL